MEGGTLASKLRGHEVTQMNAELTGAAPDTLAFDALAQTELLSETPSNNSLAQT